MNLKKLEKAASLMEQLKLLDQEIIEIDRFAMLVANGETKSSFELKVQDLVKLKEEGDKVRFDEDGSLITGMGDEFYRQMRSMMYSPFSFGAGVPEKKNTHDKKLFCELTDNAALQILGVLLCEKQTKRQVLLQKLQSYGVTV